MPIYNMQCTACEHSFDLVRSMSKAPVATVKCPVCKKKQARQVFLTPPAFHARYSPMHPRARRGKG